VQQNSDAEWGQQRHSMWLQRCSICCCDVAAAVAVQQATASSSGRALQQLLPSAKHRHQVLAGLLQQVLPAASNCFKKSMALTSTAMLLTAFIIKNKIFMTTINRWEWATETGKRMGQRQQCHDMWYFCSICCCGIVESVAMQQAMASSSGGA